MIKKLLIIMLVLFGSVLLFDIVYLNWSIIIANRNKTVKSETLPIATLNTVTKNTNTPEPSSPAIINTECPKACLEQIEKATASLSIVSPKPTAIPVVVAKVKEYYVPLGSGSTSSTTWVDLSGREAYVNPANYSKIKSITFEASLRNPSASGRVYARLINVNDNNGIFESEVYTESNTGARIESSNLNFPQTNKLYRVQMKTTMGYESFLDMARIKIVIE